MTKHSSPRVQALFYFIEAHNCGVIHCLETTPLSEVLCLNQHSKSNSLSHELSLPSAEMQGTMRREGKRLSEKQMNQKSLLIA